MNVSIKQTLTISKKGKRVIIEEDEYEFCEDIWRHIKEFVFYDPEWYNAIMLKRAIRLREEVVKYFYYPEKVDVKFKPLLKAVETKVRGRCFATPIEVRVLEALRLPRLKELSQEILRKGRRCGYKFADYCVKQWKNLIKLEQVEEDEALAMMRSHCQLNFVADSRKYLLDFLADVEEVENKLSKIKK